MISKILSGKYFVLASRLILGFVFIYAAIGKIADPSGFSDSIYNYKIFPLLIINIAAIILPWIELSAGLSLIFGIAIKENALIINSFLILFIILITISLVRGLDIDCGCFGTTNGDSIGIQRIIEDLILLLLGIQIYFFDRGKITLPGIKSNMDNSAISR
jgi:putative oxidoreductase